MSVRALVFLCVLPAATTSYAEPDPLTQCSDEYSDCHDTCALRFGMVIKDSERRKLMKCVDKCRRTQSECRAQHVAKSSGVDDPALKKDKHDDDLREDNKRQPTPDDAPPPKQPESQDVRTSTRVSDLDGPKPTTKDDSAKKDEPGKRDEPAKRDESAKKEEPSKKLDPEPSKKPDPEPSKKPDPEPSKKKDRPLDEWDPEAR
jgi:hypothetical protein